ncbi:MAG: DNA topoisomerase III, partial [Verrucomicrobia bacterium]|nr:DNA topoisomerase III [Verrucomicrobiota bacterium]
IVGFTKQLIKESDIFALNFDVYGDCPKCKSPIIKGNKGYGCSKWKEGCSYVLWKQYKDITLSDNQVRALLQKKILAQPIAGSILALSQGGQIQDIPVPQGNRSK